MSNLPTSDDSSSGAYEDRLKKVEAENEALRERIDALEVRLGEDDTEADTAASAQGRLPSVSRRGALIGLGGLASLGLARPASANQHAGRYLASNQGKLNFTGAAEWENEGQFTNTASGPHSVVGGGKDNEATGERAVVSGGGLGGQSAEGNIASETASTVGGGEGNKATGPWTTVSGGLGNEATKHWATAGGGVDCEALDYYTTVGGGGNNSARGRWSTVAGGGGNHVYDENGTIAGGGNNRVGTDNDEAQDATHATVGGGHENEASGKLAVVSGGGKWEDGLEPVGGNTASGLVSTIGGGSNNTATTQYSTVGGGHHNLAGTLEDVGGNFATVAGGRNNTARGHSSAIGGGSQNDITAQFSTVSGGHDNDVYGEFATLGGGSLNRIYGDFATIPGGQENTAKGEVSVAAGRKASADHDGAVVIGDSTDTKISSSSQDEMCVQQDLKAKSVSKEAVAAKMTLSSPQTIPDDDDEHKIEFDNVRFDHFRWADTSNHVFTVSGPATLLVGVNPSWRVIGTDDMYVFNIRENDDVLASKEKFHGEHGSSPIHYMSMATYVPEGTTSDFSVTAVLFSGNGSSDLEVDPGKNEFWVIKQG